MNDDKEQSAADLFEAAVAFKCDHKDAYDYICAFAADRAAKHQRFSCQDLSFALKFSGVLKRKDGSFKSYPNALRAPLLRMVLEDVPESMLYAEVSTSKCDCYFKRILNERKERIKKAQRHLKAPTPPAE
jgi:hypothetical protein